MESKWEAKMKEKEVEMDKLNEEIEEGQKEVRDLMHDKNHKKN